MLDVSFLNSEFFQNLKCSDEVVLHGGDGTINQFINKCIVYPHITVVKGGTGNDLVRSLKPSYQDVQVFAVNGNKFLNGFDVGLGAMVCELVNSDPQKNRLSYVRNIFRALRKIKSQAMSLEIDGRLIETNNTYLIAVQNAKYFGGGMKVTPDANVGSESLEVCVIGNCRKLFLATIFPTIFWSQHLSFKRQVQMHHGKVVTIKLQSPLIGECDGEIIAPTGVYNISQVGTVKMRTI